MNIVRLIQHPELLDRQTLYDLRSLLARYPYYQPARLLMLHNLYVLHDGEFDEELRQAAINITDRKVIFKLVEAGHYEWKTPEKPAKNRKKHTGSRTLSLIDNFLDTLPVENEKGRKVKRKPTPADAAVDYVSYLLEAEEDKIEGTGTAPQMKGQSLIDDFISQEGGKIQLKEMPEYVPETQEEEDDAELSGAGFFTETLARIYIRQGRYEKALEIIKRLNLNYPKKSAYFADQIRFLEKLIVNNKKNNKKNK